MATKKATSDAINLVKKLANDIKSSMKDATDYANDNAMSSDLQRILEKHHIPRVKKTARQNLLAYITQYIGALPKLEFIKTSQLYKSFIDSLSLIGEIMTKKINASDNTQGGVLTKIRRALSDQFGDADAETLFKESHISDSKRTVLRKQKERIKREKKHENPLKISVEEVKRCIERLRGDLDSDDIKYQNVILLLAELCFGSRIGEVAYASSYKIVKPADEDVAIDDTRRITRSMRKKLDMEKDKVKKIEYIKQIGVLKKKGKSEDTEIIKPVLPLVDDGKDILNRLMKWRSDLTEKWANKGIERDEDKNQHGRIKSNNNILLREKYLIIKDVDPQTLTSHILRKIYGVVSYYLMDGKLRGQVMTLQGFLKAVLGHEQLSTTEYYSHIVLVNDKTRQLIKLDDNSEEITQLREENAVLKAEVERLKKQLDMLTNK